MAPDAGGVRRASAAVHHAEPVSRRSGDPGGGERQYPSQTERDGVAPATGLRQLLAGVCAVAATAAGGGLGREVGRGCEAGNGALGEGAAVVGGQSLDRSGQRVSGAPAVVRSKCDGGVVGGGLCGGGKRSTLSLLGSHCGAQASLVSASAGAMAGPVPGAV